MKNFKVQTPIYIFISIIGAKGYRILYDDINGNKKITDAIDRDIVSLPEIEIKDYNLDLKTNIKFIFDMIWNACGERESINFGKDGSWIGEMV